MNPDVYARMAAMQEHHWWFRARREILAALIATLRLPPAARLLDLGAGTGANLAMLEAFGHVAAMEADPYARSFAAAATGLSVQPGTLPDDVPFAPGSFDLICLLDVLEHVENDAGALQRIETLLAPGGRVLVTVPAYGWLWSKHDETHQHHRRYTVARLRALAHGAGLRVVRDGYFNTLLFPLIALIRLLGRLTGRSSGDDERVPSPLVNRVLYTVFSMERHLIPTLGLPFGTSAFAVIARASDPR